MSDIEYKIAIGLKAHIGRITPDGGACVVKFSNPILGLELGVINFQTEGRVALLSRLGGSFVEGEEVVVLHVRKGADALAILEVR
jgi:hypothetical protein